MSARAIPIQPLIRYPRLAHAGRTYLLTIDLEHHLPFDEWPYEQEEYPLTCLLESLPYFEHQPQGDTTLIIHRFGGTYGEVRFAIKSTGQTGEARLRLLFINSSGLPVHIAEVADIHVLNERTSLAERLPSQKAEHNPKASDRKNVYFNGVNPRGKYLTAPASLKQIVERLPHEREQEHPDRDVQWRQQSADAFQRKPSLPIDPSDLAQTGWAVIFGPDVDQRVREALNPLLELRHEQASRDFNHGYRQYTYNGETTYNFLIKHGARPGRIADLDSFPYYILLVGSPEKLPYDFQAELAVDYAVGRICFDDPTDYAAYAQSVVNAERRSRLRSREVVFFGTEHPADPSTRALTEELIRPLAGSLLEPGMPWRVREVLGREARKERLRSLLGGTETPALLFAACHGLGFEPEDERQENSQGALVCQDWPGPDDEEGIAEDQWFAASDVPKDASLHGLIAFFYASYSVGTSVHDDFELTTLGRQRPNAPRPLIAHLPQRLLAHRAGGALAVIGHVDRASTLTFSDSRQGAVVSAFLYGVRRLLQGHTVGWAMDHLNQSRSSLSVILTDMLESSRRGAKMDEELFAKLWFVRDSARNLMIFGDPAVRLPGVGEPW